MNIRETIDTARDDYYIDIRSGDNGVVKSFPIAELRAELDKPSNSFPTDRMDWMRPSKAKETRIEGR